MRILKCKLSKQPITGMSVYVTDGTGPEEVLLLKHFIDYDIIYIPIGVRNSHMMFRLIRNRFGPLGEVTLNQLQEWFDPYYNSTDKEYIEIEKMLKEIDSHEYRA